MNMRSLLTRTAILGAIATIALALLSQSVAEAGPGRGQGRGAGQGKGAAPSACCGAGACCQTAPATAAQQSRENVVPLTEAESAGLHALIADEYHSRAVYHAILDAFGSKKPLSHIVMAEDHHVAALTGQFEMYGLPVPEDGGYEIPSFATYRDALAWAVQAEEENAALFDTYMEQTDKESLKTVYGHLRDASRLHHKVALARALSRISG